MKRMDTCGLKVDGFTPRTLCGKFGRTRLNFLASRSCAEFEAMLGE